MSSVLESKNMNYQRIITTLRDPVKIPRYLNRMYHSRLNRREYNTKGINIISKDWDILLLLDACRADLFEDVSELNGKYSRVLSRGAMTREFLLGNFGGCELHDTVYVTANPMYHRYREQIDCSFHAVINVWKDDGWDPKYNTVLPETVVKYALKANEQYPNKRLIVHFMQPHYPFLVDQTALDASAPDPVSENDLWGRLRYRELDISIDRIWNEYKQTLKRTLPHVERLVDEIKGLTVVTSDHGNMIGERSFPLPIQEWGHPPSLYVEELVSVPWLVYKSSDRRSIISAQPEKDAEAEVANVENRLQQLGYMN